MDINQVRERLWSCLENHLDRSQALHQEHGTLVVTCEDGRRYRVSVQELIHNTGFPRVMSVKTGEPIGKPSELLIQMCQEAAQFGFFQTAAPDADGILGPREPQDGGQEVWVELDERGVWDWKSPLSIKGP